MLTIKKPKQKSKQKQKRIPSPQTKIAVKWMRKYKRTQGCYSCRDRNTDNLTFHHLDKTTKEESVSTLIHKGYSFDRIKHEADKCVILCHDCHRKVHSNLLELIIK